MTTTSTMANALAAETPRQTLAWSDYARWLATIAGGQYNATGGGEITLPLPSDGEPMVASLSLAETTPLEALSWLAQQMETQDKPLFARPIDRPLALHEITPKLFDAYQIDDGQMHVAGCRIADRPFVVVSVVDDQQDPATVTQWVCDDQGQPIDEALANRLGLLTTAACGAHPPRVKPDAAQEAGKAALDSMFDGNTDQVHSVVIALPRWASGGIEFELGEESTRVEFADWAAELAPPAIPCPQSGVLTHHLAATHDGRIAAVEQLANCSLTGHRHLASELALCETTGKLAEESATIECPVTGGRSLESSFAICDSCKQLVSGAALEAGICRTCRSLEPVRLDDPKLQALVSQYPLLADYRRFKLAESRDTTVLEAAGWWRRLLLVADRETHRVLHVGTAAPFTRGWNGHTKSDFERLLGSTSTAKIDES